jgi:glucose-6-phosphate 1-dehydrogenase
MASDTADLLVIFGITGDLARKMTFRSLYRLERRELLRCPILGKEPVIELEYLRFTNLALAEVWDRKSVSGVQITQRGS